MHVIDLILAFYKTNFNKKDKDTLWTLTNNLEAQFIDLTPGNYSFGVQASDNKGEYTSDRIELEFKIQKHYSQTVWFKSLVTLLLLFVGFLLYRAREKTLIRRSKQKEELQETQLRLKAAELNALRNQMNPHFIYNALNSIQNYIFRGDPEKANYLLSRFGQLMRSSLKLSGLEYITIETELKFLNNYLELEQMRFDDQFTYEVNLSSDDMLDLKIPPLLLQPLLENSIKHGIEGKKNGHLILDILEDNTYIILSVEDNGKGYNPKENSRRIGPSALSIIRERIQLINKDRQTPSSFEIKEVNSESREKGTKAIIKLAKTYNEGTHS